MPTYEYRCESCGYEFEEFQTMTDAPLEVCPRCGGEVHRLISGGAGFLFKGHGFYVTDYRSKDYREKAKKDNGDGKPAKADKPEKKSSGDDAASKSSQPAKA